MRLRREAAQPRAVIYARFSSEPRREASFQDLIELCRRYVERQGWKLVDTYEDAALSGASKFRPGFQQLSLMDVDRGMFDIVIVEALDRLGRKLADAAEFHDRLTFAGVKLYTVNYGAITSDARRIKFRHHLPLPGSKYGRINAGGRRVAIRAWHFRM